MTDFPDFDPDGEEVVNREVISHEQPSTDRSVARRLALQALYEIDSAQRQPGVVLSHFLERWEDEPRKILNYFVLLVSGISKRRNRLDALLQRYAPEWPIAQVAIVDRNILRIALYEMAVETRTPVGVAIDEAIELAKLFGAENTARFVNGVLGTVADNLSEVRSVLGTNDETTPDESVE